MSTPSLLNIPYVIKAGTLYSQIPETGAGDFTVTRATTPTANLSTRINANGFIELVNDNVPRLDYPLGGAVNGCPALLVEPSAQNLIKQSEAFNTAEYTLVRLNAFGSGSVVNTTATKDPFNGNNADYLQEDSTASNTHLINQFNAGQVSGTNLTFSIFVKAAERTRISLFNSGGGAGNASFDLTAGTATLVNGVSASIQNYGNGWYRCILTYTPNATGNFNVQVLLADASGNTTYNGTGNSGLYVFGAQVETGSVATSYIPTTTQAITRGADAVTKTGIASLIGQSEGTIYVEFNMQTLGVEGYAIRLVAASFDNSVHIRRSTANLVTLELRSGGSNVFSQTFSATGFVKAAIAYKSGDIAAFVNGTQAGSTSTSAFTFGASFTSVNLGTFGAAAFLNDRIRAAALYPNRLSNSELATLTTP